MKLKSRLSAASRIHKYLGVLLACQLHKSALLDCISHGLHQIGKRCGLQLLKLFNVEFCGSHTSFLSIDEYESDQAC